MSSPYVVCCIYFLIFLTDVSTGSNSVDPDQTVPTGAVWSGSTLFVKDASKTFQQMIKADDFVFDWRIKGQSYP